MIKILVEKSICHGPNSLTSNTTVQSMVLFISIEVPTLKREIFYRIEYQHHNRSIPSSLIMWLKAID